MLLVALTVQWNKPQILVGSQSQKRAGECLQGRRLIKVAVKAPEDPVELGNSQGRADAGAGYIFDHTPGKVGLPEAGIQVEPRIQSELIFRVERCKAAHRIYLRGR